LTNFLSGSFGHSIESYVLANLWFKLFSHHTQEMVYLAGEGNIELDFKLNPQAYYFTAQGIKICN